MYRKLLTSKVFTSSTSSPLKTWMWLLLRARYSPIPEDLPYGVTVKRGQILTSNQNAWDEIKTTKSTFRKHLEQFKKEMMITVETTKHFTLVTILNFSEIQDNGVTDVPTELPTELPTDLPYKKKVKKVNKVKNIEFIPPTEKEMIDYFITNGFSKELAVRAFKGYGAADWHDSQGNKVRNWKQKAQNVWFKDENKAKLTTAQVLATKKWTCPECQLTMADNQRYQHEGSDACPKYKPASQSAVSEAMESISKLSQKMKI